MLFWSHLVAGVVAGAVVLIMSATGVLLTYQKQMTHWADLRSLEEPRAARMGTAMLAVDSVLAIVRAAGEQPTSVIIRARALEPVEVVLTENRRVFVDRATGDMLGEGATSTRAFFREVTAWHRWLARTGESRDTGRAITGASNLLFLFLVLSGFVLWWPRQWTRVAFRNVLAFRSGLSSKARDFNWHHVLGFWSVVPLIAIVASGVVISYRWAGNLVVRSAGETPPPASASAPESPAVSARAAEAQAAPVIGIDSLMTASLTRMPAWRSVSVTLPRGASGTYALTLDRGMGGEPHKRATLTVDPRGSTPRWQPFDSLPTSRRWRSYLRFAHTGEVFGVTGQTIAGLVSLASVVLVYTGLALSWRRLVAYRRRRALASS